MMRKQEELSDARYQSIIQNDQKADGQFLYGVKSTKIFCHPSCASRPPKRENVVIFTDAQSAQSANYRPCKRCKPTGTIVPDSEWALQVSQYITAYYDQHITLEQLGEECHGSPYHLQRVFKKATGKTPLEYLTAIRIEKAQELLRETTLSCARIGQKVGLGNPAYFATLFKKEVGQSPSSYRQQQKVFEPAVE